MAFAEDLDVFLDVPGGFAVDATLLDPAIEDDEGVPLKLIFDSAGIDEFGVITPDPSALAKTSDCAGAVDKTLRIGLADYYTVRSAAGEPPDSAFTRLTLARL